MKLKFAWDEWNREHIDKHGVSEPEAEYVVRYARPPFPREAGGGKKLVRGQTQQGRYLQVIYAMRDSEAADYESMTLDDIIALDVDDVPKAYIVHARDLTLRERANYRRNR